jgi:hypothetical protein
LARGTEAAESGARSDFKLALIALSQKIPATTRLMRVRIVPVDPGTGFALHDLVSIFIAFRVEEFSSSLVAYWPGQERYIILVSNSVMHP